jgi:predicted deacylase
MGPVTAKRRVVVIGVIHGNERAGARVTSLMRRLGPPGECDWLVPAFNVDGWARNRRTNDAGVDLNRNFPKAWRLADRGGPTTGPRAASEPETRAMTRFLAAVNPGLVVIFHQPLDGVDAYGAKSMPTVRALSRATGLPVRVFDCRGGCHGTLTQWFNATRRGQAITVEFGGGTPASSQIARVARGVLAVGASSHVLATG